MKCTKCGADGENGKFCSSCGNKLEENLELEETQGYEFVEGEQKELSTTSVNKRKGFWGEKGRKFLKKLVLVFTILLLICGIFVSSGIGTKKDAIVEIITYYAYLGVLYMIPVGLIMNLGGIRDKLPLFKHHKLGKTVLGSLVVYMVMGFLCMGIAFGMDSLHTETYKIEHAKMLEERAKEAEKKAREEEEKKAEEEAQEEAEKKAEEKAQKETKKKEQENDTELSFVFETDVKNKKLYVDKNGDITDKSGQIIKEYANIWAMDSATIVEEETATILEGYYVGKNKQIRYEKPKEEDVIVPTGKLQELKLKAQESGCEKKVNKVKLTNGGYTQMADDGSYFDEVVLNAWFDKNGNPKADYPPDALWNAHTLFGLDRFYFIDNEIHTLNMVKRNGATQNDTFALVLTDIAKQSDYNNQNYFVGWEYITGEPVVVYGNFNGLLNGDDVLVFAKYRGIATDDTINFDGFFLEFINNREISY